jgi:cytoskeleton-associated protein 5
VGEKVWSLVGTLSPKDRTQLEERLRRVAGPSVPAGIGGPPQASQMARLTSGIARAGSPAPTSRIGGIPRPSSPSVVGTSRLARPSSPAQTLRSISPAPGRSSSPARISRVPAASNVGIPQSPTGISRPKTMLPSRLGRPRNYSNLPEPANQDAPVVSGSVPSHLAKDTQVQAVKPNDARPDGPEDITVTISSILSSDPSRSVDALKKIQKILAVGPAAGPSSAQYRELAEHTEGLIETITLQMAHIFDRPEDLVPGENFRLAKHLIQTLNNFCDHAFLAESLTVDILTSLLEELTLRLLETDDSQVKEVKDLSRFINMIILRLFATGRRMSIFRCVVLMSVYGIPLKAVVAHCSRCYFRL